MTTNSEIDLSKFANAADPGVRAQVAEWAAQNEARKRKEEARKNLVSPPGAFPHLSEFPLLEEKRLALSIPDFFFNFTWPVGDKVFLFQIDDWKDRRFSTDGAASLIELPDSEKEYQTNVAPRGVILAAGIDAMNSLRSYGVDVGHTVQFTNIFPKRIRVGLLDGKAEYILQLRDGDINASEELCERIRKGELKRFFDSNTGRYAYVHNTTAEFFRGAAERNTSGDT